MMAKKQRQWPIQSQWKLYNPSVKRHLRCGLTFREKMPEGSAGYTFGNNSIFFNSKYTAESQDFQMRGGWRRGGVPTNRKEKASPIFPKCKLRKFFQGGGPPFNPPQQVAFQIRVKLNMSIKMSSSFFSHNTQQFLSFEYIRFINKLNSQSVLIAIINGVGYQCQHDLKCKHTGLLCRNIERAWVPLVTYSDVHKAAVQRSAAVGTTSETVPASGPIHGLRELQELSQEKSWYSQQL